jgi:hypothetical protein
MDRRAFVVGSAAAGLLGQAAAPGVAQGPRQRLEVRYQPYWLSWVASVTPCLQALGCPCDAADVAGMSGYAFHMAVNRGHLVSGPTSLPWSELKQGVQGLGRSTVEFRALDWGYGGPESAERSQVYCREALELVKREIANGRPCVAWGTYDPEFGIAVGVEGDAYLVSSFRGITGEKQPPIPYDKLTAPTGPYVLGFPTPVPAFVRKADRDAICRALQNLYRPPGVLSSHYGLAAYGPWIAELEAHEAGPFGNSYCAQCYAEAKRFARDFVGRLLERNDFAAESLSEAHLAYGQVAEAVGRVAEAFPFPGQGGNVEDVVAITTACDALREAEAAEAQGAGSLRAALDVEWPDD